MSAGYAARSVRRAESVDPVRALQRVLYRVAKSDQDRRFHALYGHVSRRDVLWRAWYEVSLNHGAPGVDGVSIADIEALGVDVLLAELSAELEAGEYRPQPLRRVWIPKSTAGEFRPLSIPTVRDRVVMSAAKLVLEPVFEAVFLPSSFGFRPGRSAHDAIEAARVAVNGGRRRVLDADVRNCFGSINHDALMRLIEVRVSDRRMLKLLRSWLRVGVLDQGGYQATEAGTPQGSPISPLLANIALHELDRVFDGRRNELGILVRYADDFVVLVNSPLQARAAQQRAAEVLAELGLELHPGKTGIRNLAMGEEGFDFLGFHLRMRRSARGNRKYHLHHWPSKKSMQRIRVRIRELTNRKYVGMPMDRIVERLNRLLRGWGAYFQWGNSTREFKSIDSYVHWRLAKLSAAKHGRRRRDWATRHDYAWMKRIGVYQLTGTIQYWPTHATR